MLGYGFTGSITGSTVLVLANAVHFKSGWAHKFKDTNDEPFYLTPTNTVQVKMMSLSHDLLYYHSDELKFAALELPYEVIILKIYMYKLKFYLIVLFRIMLLK